MKIHTNYVVISSFDGSRAIIKKYVNFDSMGTKFTLVDELHEATIFSREEMAKDYMKWSNIENELHADTVVVPIYPRVGMRITQGIGSDRYPYEVVETDGKVIPNRISVRRMKTNPIENFNYYSNQIYTYESDLDASTMVMTLRSDGYYRPQGHKKGSEYWSFGYAEYYQDPSF